MLIAYASSESSGEPAHSCSLARTFAARSYKQWIKRNLQTERQIPGPSEWLGMCSWNLSWRNAQKIRLTGLICHSLMFFKVMHPLLKSYSNYITNAIHLGPVKRICVFEHSVMTNLTAHAQPFRGARDLASCLKVPLDSLLVWASSEGSGETVPMPRLAWTFAARIGDKYQIRLTWSISIIFVVYLSHKSLIFIFASTNRFKRQINMKM